MITKYLPWVLLSVLVIIQFFQIEKTNPTVDPTLDFLETTQAPEKIAKLLLYGCVLMGLSYVWDLGFPINKKIWTSSYVLLTVGINLVTLGGLIYLIDFKPHPMSFKFFEVFGMNSLFAFILSVLWVKVLIYVLRWTNDNGKTSTAYGWLYKEVFVPIAGKMNGSLLFALAHILLFGLVLWVLYRRRIFIKV